MTITTDNAKPDIGQTVTFKDAGTTRQGKVVGVEEVEGDRRRRSGVWYAVQPAAGEWLPVHESDVGGVIN